MNYWTPYIIESHHPVQLLTDSHPCVQVYTKLGRGTFSCNSRVSTFLSILSRYNVTLQYIPGSNNLPADYQSRDPAECSDRSCQICKFIGNSEDSSVFHVTVSDVLDGKKKCLSSRLAYGRVHNRIALYYVEHMLISSKVLDPGENPQM